MTPLAVSTLPGVRPGPEVPLQTSAPLHIGNSPVAIMDASSKVRLDAQAPLSALLLLSKMTANKQPSLNGTYDTRVLIYIMIGALRLRSFGFASAAEGYWQISLF